MKSTVLVRAATKSHAASRFSTSHTRCIASLNTSTKPPSKEQTKDSATADKTASSEEEHSSAGSSTKTQAQQDEELRQKLAAMSGEGGEAGIEYEDGRPVSMKRGYGIMIHYSNLHANGSHAVSARICSGTSEFVFRRATATRFRSKATMAEDLESAGSDHDVYRA